MTRTILAAVLAITLGACGDDDNHGHTVIPDGRGPDAPRPDADMTDAPRIEPTACRFHVASSLGLVEGSNYYCGDLVVEENRETHVNRIRVHFIRIKSSVTSNNATIYLDGGPGGDGQGILDYAAYRSEE